MIPEIPAHLSIDELDALHDGSASPRATSHIATCLQCTNLLAQDRRVLALLAALPTWDASPRLAVRVLAELHPHPTLAPAATPGSTADRAMAARRRVMVGGLLTGSLVTAGCAWAAFNPTTAAGLAGPIVQEVTHALWLAVQAVTANTLEQPWFGAVRDALATPARAVPLLAVAGLTYVAVLIGFRKVLSRSVTRASW
ncbi:MAG TPA: hypothetical protein VFN22_02095 [Gemmatimonadales bacterium]|nr:hypothetical protein [Gemmatimonadales bacterium]